MIRTDKELIQLVLDNFDEYFSSGVCNLINRLFWASSMTEDEFFRLHQLIELHRPDSTRDRVYWWRSGEREPRIEFLNNILKTLS